MNSEEGVEFYLTGQDEYGGGGVVLGEDEDDDDDTFLLDLPSQSSLAKRKHAFQHFTEVTDDRTGDVCRSKPNRKTRCAATHRRNERLRRQKFRERMDILRQLIPTGDKKDNSSTLDDAIRYIQMLHTHIQMTSMAQINSNPNHPAFPHPAVRGGVGNGMNLDTFHSSIHHPMSIHFGLSDPSLLDMPDGMGLGGPYMLESTSVSMPELGTLPDVGGHGMEPGNHVLPML